MPPPGSNEPGPGPRRPRRYRRRGALLLVALVAGVAGIAQLGGFAGQDGVRPGAPSAEVWSNPGMGDEAWDPESATTKFLIRDRPRVDGPQASARVQAEDDLGIAATAPAAPASEGGRWEAIGVDEPIEPQELALELDDTGVVEVIPDPPRWMLGTSLTLPATATIPSRFHEQWYLNTDEGVDIDGPEAWDAGGTGDGIVVAVIDSGVDASHPELAGKLLPGYNVTDVGARNDVMDEIGHGTAVSSLIVASGASMYGVARDARVLPIKVFSPGYLTTSADIATAVDVAVDRGADIINLSLGCILSGPDVAGTCRSEVELAAIRRARAAGVLIVAAAGNRGDSNDEVLSYPQNYAVDNIVTVAATDVTGARVAWSNHGATSVHVAAPGEDVLVAVAGGGYARADGTSFSAPLAAGAAALLRQAAPELDAAGARSALIQSVLPSAGLVGEVASGGTVNADRAARVQADPTIAVPAPGPDRYEELHGPQSAAPDPRPPRMTTPRAGGTVAPSGRPYLRWSLPPSSDVYEIAVTNSPQTTPTTSGRWLTRNDFGASWASARREEGYRPVGRLEPGRYWWQVISWDEAAGAMAFSQVRSFTVPARAQARRPKARARSGGRSVRVATRVRSNERAARMTITLWQGRRKVGRISQPLRLSQSQVWTWRSISRNVRLRSPIKRGQRIRVDVAVHGRDARTVARRTIRVR